MRIKYPDPIEKVIEAACWDLSEHLYRARVRGATYRELAEANGMDRETVKRYAQTYEGATRRYGWDGDHPPSCNEIQPRCKVCGSTFTASRADARYCSNACRQDAYRKRKLGAEPVTPPDDAPRENDRSLEELAALANREHALALIAEAIA